MTEEEKTKEINAHCHKWNGLIQALEEQGTSPDVLLSALLTVFATYYAHNIEDLDGLENELKALSDHITFWFNRFQKLRSDEAIKQ